MVCKRRCSEVLGKPLGTVIKEALLNLEYRGYDSVGFAIVGDEGKIVIRKKPG